MWVDVDRLDAFYQTKLGGLVQFDVGQNVNQLLNVAKNNTVVGYGYTYPYMDLFGNATNSVVTLAPMAQGGRGCLLKDQNISCVSEELLMPLLDRSVDKLFICHSFEFVNNIPEFLKECYRVLADDGEILMVVPNRRGLWAHNANTPLGYGMPYTGAQLSEILTNHMFNPISVQYGLFTLPNEMLFRYGLDKAMEFCTKFVSAKFGGVLYMLARKQVLSATFETKSNWGYRVLNPAH